MIDLELIEQCRSGNFNNFRKIVGIVSPFAYSVAFRMLGNEDEAKDLVQETMITVWQKMDKIKSPEGFKKWMYRIVVNKCYDQLRRRKRNIEFGAGETVWNTLSEKISGSSVTDLENEEMAMIIKHITNKLSPKQKAVFILSELEEMSADEISEITGMSKTGIKSNLHFAKRNIEEMVGKYL